MEVSSRSRRLYGSVLKQKEPRKTWSSTGTLLMPIVSSYILRTYTINKFGNRKFPTTLTLTLVPVLLFEKEPVFEATLLGLKVVSSLCYNLLVVTSDGSKTLL
jgi:hypothetical protein